jgi:hypothetical protein
MRGKHKKQKHREAHHADAAPTLPAEPQPLAAEQTAKPKNQSGKDSQTSKAGVQSITGLILAALVALIYMGQLFYMRQSVQLTSKTLRMDQRAWMTSKVGQFSEIKENSELPVQMIFTNTGKTPAKHIAISILIQKRKRDEEPSLNFDANTPKEWTGLMFPNVPQPFTFYLMEEGSLTKRVTLSREMRDEIADGRSYLMISGEITYSDMFDVPHWTKFCSFTKLASPNTRVVDRCTYYNDVDRNDE